MEYRYGKNENYEYLASGRVLYSGYGVPNFPVRLAQEIYGRCLSYSSKKDNIRLYDCCCGGGYLLTVLGLLNQDSIGELIGSDIEDASLLITNKNLSLLSTSGIDNRIDELTAMYNSYKKVSHQEAIQSGNYIKSMIQKDISVRLFKADILEKLQEDIHPDIIITDIPYGNLVDWHGQDDCMTTLLNTLEHICTKETILCICMNKKQKVSSNRFKRLEKQLIGKRKFEIYKLNV